MKRLTPEEAEALVDEVQAIISAKCGQATPYFVWICGQEFPEAPDTDMSASNIKPTHVGEVLRSLADEHDKTEGQFEDIGRPFRKRH